MLILASNSPRRKELLTMLGYEFVVRPSDCDENTDISEPCFLVKVLSFGIVSEMFSILKTEDQKDIARIYEIDPEELMVYLPILANYRNLCAHEDILYENKTQKAINDTVYHQLLKIRKEDDEYVYGKNDVFALIIIMRQMLQNEDFKNMTIEL